MIGITGGTGSLGQALVAYYIQKGYEVLVFSRDEAKQDEMRRQYSAFYVVGDVRDAQACKIFQDCEAVIHCAALKQVPVGEQFPLEMVQTNILGTQNVLRYAPNTVAISTDKACHPTSVYGMTKGIMERIVLQHMGRVVRLGNLLGSRGSVLPLWRQQVKDGLPITVTDPEMTRFFLAIPEAAQHIYHAESQMDRGRVYIPLAGACRMGDMARCLSEDVRIIGSRPGERQHEMLLTAEEAPCASRHPAHIQLHPGVPGGVSPYCSQDGLMTPTQIQEMINEVAT